MLAFGTLFDKVSGKGRFPYSQVDNIPDNFESGHFYYYDGVMRIEAYLPGPTIYCGN